jgi:hypothetical protein
MLEFIYFVLPCRFCRSIRDDEAAEQSAAAGKRCNNDQVIRSDQVITSKP